MEFLIKNIEDLDSEDAKDYTMINENKKSNSLSTICLRVETIMVLFLVKGRRPHCLYLHFTTKKRKYFK